jgi:hypothetical protein
MNSFSALIDASHHNIQQLYRKAHPDVRRKVQAQYEQIEAFLQHHMTRPQITQKRIQLKFDDKIILLTALKIEYITPKRADEFDISPTGDEYVACDYRVIATNTANEVLFEDINEHNTQSFYENMETQTHPATIFYIQKCRMPTTHQV